MFCRSVAVLALATASVVQGAQDTAYYPGYTNPNVLTEEYYYRDALNVLQGIAAGDFDALYIQYHGCVWSEYATGGDGDEDGCGADGDDNNSWYMGRTPCYRANAAYSLYGTKKGQSGKCTRGHFINSFFTNYGLESFANPLGVDYADTGASSECTSEEDGNNNNNGVSHGSMLFENYVSYGTGCSASGGFIRAKFQGAYCDGNHFLSSTATFDGLDESFGNMNCKKVYDSEGDYAASAHGGNGGGDVEGNIPGEDSIGFQLLAYSSACSVLEYPERCPDPHGLKSARDKALDRAAKAHYRKVPVIMPILTSIFFVAGLVLLFLSRQIDDTVAEDDALDDPMMGVRSGEMDGLEPHLLNRVSESFARTATNLSQRTMSIKERLRDYAEEEVFSMDTLEDDAGNYSAPAETKKSTLDEEPVIVTDTDVANAMLSEKGINPPSKADAKKGKDGKKYKRPWLARCSRKLFGRKKKAIKN